MTGKRFTLKEYVTNHYGILDNGKEIAYADHRSAFTICDLLNTLNNENEQLKQFKDTTFVLINEMIETANHYRTPIKSLEYGEDLGYWNGVHQKLKELREILEKEKGDD